MDFKYRMHELMPQEVFIYLKGFKNLSFAKLVQRTHNVWT